ncbi:hypothetical protein Dimus_035044 [Dionaea muscipula]
MMRDKDVKGPLLLRELIDQPMKAKDDSTTSLKRRRHYRSKSAPLEKTDPLGYINVADSSTDPPSVFDWHDNPSLVRVFMILALYVGAGTICFFMVRDQLKGKKTDGIVDAIYFCIVTMTTVGYGDLVPGSTLAKLLACLFVFSGMAVVGILLSRAADFLVEKQENLFAMAIHLRDKVPPAACSDNNIIQEAVLETNKTKYKLIMALMLMLVLGVVGTFVLTAVEKMRLVDALYCVCATITTLGYGDESFSTKGGRVFAVFWILSSTICLAQFYFYLAELYTERRQRSLVKWVLERKLTYQDIEAADLDNDKVVSASEFILFKLKEMKKINQEDISVLMECFRNLDVDQSGTLTAADIMPA